MLSFLHLKMTHAHICGNTQSQYIQCDKLPERNALLSTLSIHVYTKCTND
jgi:hypothetical protein